MLAGKLISEYLGLVKLGLVYRDVTKYVHLVNTRSSLILINFWLLSYSGLSPS